MNLDYKLDINQTKELTDEAVKHLSNYIKIDTSNPPGNTDAGLEYFKNIFESEGIEYKIYTSKSNKKSILAWIKSDGSKGKPLLLLNHIDVVPANSEDWSFEPFSGDIKNGYILGRGALDMKEIGIAQLMCVLKVKRENIHLKRDLMFLAVPDEETGGLEGTKYVVDNYFQDIEPAVVLDEGGFGTKCLTKSKPVFFVSCGQKKGVWLRIRAHGQAGHGSQPHKENPNDILIKALNRVIENPYPVDLNEDIWYALKRLGKERSWLQGWIVSMYRWPFIGGLLGRYFQRYEFFNALVRNTLTITMLEAGSKVNMIPTTAEATIDCRVLPHVKVEDVLNRLKRIINDSRVEIEIIKNLREAATSSFHSEFLSILNYVLKDNFKDSIILPYITPVGTDAKYFRERNVEGYGIFPIFVDDKDLKTFHGNDEKILIDNFSQGCKITYELVINYCA